MQQFQSTFRLGNFGLAVTLGSLFVASSFATTIQPGQANIAGTATVGTNYVNFSNNGIPNTYTAQQPNTGGFSGLTGGTIQNLNMEVPNPFVTFNTASGLVSFDLLGFNPGIGTGACSGSAANMVGNTCTPAGSFFTLIQRQPSQVEIDLSVYGISYLGSAATGSSPTSGLFTTQNLIPGTITGVLNQVQSGGSTNAYSATFSATSPAPEPASMLMLGSGLIGLGLWSRKKFYGGK